MNRLIKKRRQIDASAPEPHFSVKLFASGFFTGYVPIASGTLGSIAALMLYFIPGFESLFILGPVILFVFILGVEASSIMENKYGHDPAEVTIDEMTGMWIALFLLPKTILIAFTAFIIFRFLDIFKLYPASWFDKKSGGYNIMMDDVISGLYTNIIVRVLLFIPSVNEFLG